MRVGQPGRVFFDLLAEAAHNVVDAATVCAELYDRYPESGDRVRRIRGYEREGDRVTAQIHTLLNGTFVTPIDRQDILALATALDNICDLVDESATTLGLLAPPSVPERARAQARIVQLACERLSDATDRLPRLPDLSAELEDVYALEEEADRIRRDALARLFAGGDEPLEVIRQKSLHESLERAVDATKAAARALEAVVVKSR